MTIHDILAYLPWDLPLPSERYQGTGLEWSIENLAPFDRDSICTFYDQMNELMQLPVWTQDEPGIRRDTILQWAQDQGWVQCWRNVTAMGPESYAMLGSDYRLRQVIHDLRGGPLTSLVLAMSMLKNGKATDTDYIWLLARDVRKIARNCFPDLDQQSYRKDRGTQKHALSLLSDKWRRVSRGGGVDITANFDGDIANSCVEFAALDRTIYNLMNNALRESATTDEPVRLFMLAPEKPAVPQHVRFWIRNPVHPSQTHRIQTKFGSNLHDLFLTNFSTTGSGIGMQIVSDFVGQAYDLGARDALQKKILGAFIENGYFNTWFHWPVVD